MIKRYWPSGRPRGWSASASHPRASGPAPIQNTTAIPSSDMTMTIERIDLSKAQSLTEGERGAILVVDGEFGGGPNELSIGLKGFNQDSVRGTLLLFDKIDTPYGNFIGAGAIPGLEDRGIVGGVYVEVAGAIGLPTVQAPIIEAFKALNERDGGRWSLTRSLDSLRLPDHLFAPNKAIELQLLDAVPLPCRNVHYDEILNFKQRRRDELIALRHFIEGLGLEATRDGVNQLGTTLAFEKLDRALADYNAVMRETNFEKIRRTLSCKFQVDNAAVGAVIVAGVSASFGLPLLDSAVGALAGAVGQIGVNVIRGLKDNRMAGKPFEYVFHANTELR